jgi:hypothetical protein
MVEDARTYLMGFFFTLHEFPVVREESHTGWLRGTPEQNTRRSRDAEGTETQR